MRTLTDAQTAVMALSDYKVKIKVYIKDSDGTWQDLSNFNGYDWIDNVSYGETIDQPVSNASVSLYRNVYWLSLSPLMEGSALNKNAAGAYAALINVGSEIKIETATVPIDYTPVTADYINVFEGKIDVIDWGESRVRLECRDKAGDLQDNYIETEVSRGADDLSKDAEDVMQDILTGAGTGVTLYTPSASSWALKAYTQQKEPVHQALLTIALQLGWTVRYKWDSGTSAWRLTFYEPDRVKSVADRTFSASQYTNISRISLNIAGIRNIVRIVYTDGSTGLRKTLEYPENGTATAGGAATLTDTTKAWTTNQWAEYELWIVSGTGAGQHQTIASNTGTEITVDTGWVAGGGAVPDNTSKYAVVNANDSAQSLISYGRRFMEIAEDANSQIDSATEARTMARAIYNDVSRPTAEQEVNLRYFPFTELGDLYTFTANNVHYDSDQTLAIVGVRHDLFNGTGTTTFITRGKPSGGYQRWFERQAIPGVAPASKLIAPAQPTNFTLDATPRGMRVEASSYVLPEDFSHFEIFVGLATSFTVTGFNGAEWTTLPNATTAWDGGANTLFAYTKSMPYVLTNLNAQSTYYIKIVAVDLDGNRSIPSAELSTTAGALQRSTTIVVAASDADPAVIAGADYICDGANDEIQINAAFNALPSLLIHSGTAQAGAATTITLVSTASSNDDEYTGLSISITSGTGSGQTKRINDYVGSTKVATVNSAWAVNPDATSVYSISATHAGRIVLSEGHFNCKASVLYPGYISYPSYLTLEGQGPGTIVKAYFDILYGFTNALIDLSDRSNHVTISNMVLDVNDESSMAYGAIYGIRAYKTSIKNISIINSHVAGIYFESSSHIFVDKCMITNNASNGIRFAGGNNAEILNCTVKNNTLNGMRISCTESKVVNSTVSYNGGYGIYLEGNNCLCNGNIIEYNQKDGIYLTSSSNSKISNNYLNSNSQLTDNTYSNIVFASDCDDVLIDNNTCRRGSGANQPQYAINISAATNDRTMITNNDLYTGGKTGDINDAGTGTVINNNKDSGGILQTSSDITDLCAKAWVNFDQTTAADISGTYVRTGTTIVVTATAHGHLVGHVVYCDFTSGTAADGGFQITAVTTNTFTFTHGTSGNTSGNVTIKRDTIRSSVNIHSITRLSVNGHSFVNFSTAMPDANYCVGGLSGANFATNSYAIAREHNQTWARSTVGFAILCQVQSGGVPTPANHDSVNLIIYSL